MMNKLEKKEESFKIILLNDQKKNFITKNT